MVQVGLGLIVVSVIGVQVALVAVDCLVVFVGPSCLQFHCQMTMRSLAERSCCFGSRLLSWLSERGLILVGVAALVDW